MIGERQKKKKDEEVIERSRKIQATEVCSDTILQGKGKKKKVILYYGHIQKTFYYVNYISLTLDLAITYYKQIYI